MRGYLANGNGTPRSYWRRLNERTLSEMQIYERTRRELEKETRPEVWEQKNESLRILGLRTIPAPNEWSCTTTIEVGRFLNIEKVGQQL